MNMIKQLLDKIFFTIGVIVFLQLPHFIDQYTQRIGGYSESQMQQLNSYQSIANNNYQGDLSLLIKAFNESSDAAVNQTGENIDQTQKDVKLLKQEIKVLENNGLFDKMIFLMTNVRMNIAKGTIQSFKPGIPLSLWALAYGLFGGILFSLLFNSIVKVPQLVKKIPRGKKTIYSS